MTALVERLSKQYPFKKGCEEGVEERLARGELGQRIMQRRVHEGFEMFGEDNVLLSQVNPYSVVTSSRNTVIATANTQHLFRLLSEGGKPFLDVMREQCQNTQDARCRNYVLNYLPKDEKESSKKAEDDAAENKSSDSAEEHSNKAELDKSKNKFLLSKDLVKRYPFAQKAFKMRLENQLNQGQKHGEALNTSNLQHKQLYGYIHSADALRLQAVK